MHDVATASRPTAPANRSEGGLWTGWVISGDRPQLQPGSWVEVGVFLSPMAYDRGLLLCPASDHAWALWIPDYGEAIVETRYLSLVGAEN